MTLETRFQDESRAGLAGFRLLLAKEMKSWWGTRRWLVQGLLWTLALNGLLFVALFLLPPLMAAQGEDIGDPLVVGGQMFFALGMMAISVGVVILTQGEVIDERESGTAAWILSKPVSRAAFIGSKLLANGLSILVLMVLLPSVAAFVQMSIASSGAVPLTGFLSALLLLTLHVLFYLTLTIMLGVLMKNRGAILGVSLGVLLGGMLLRSLPYLGLVMPWVLPDVAGAVLADPGQLFLPPVLASAIWVIAFTAVALASFEKSEL